MPIPSWKTDLVEVAPGVFAYIQGGGGLGISNAGFIVGDEGVMVIDALMVPSMTRPFVEALRKVTDKPIRHLVNTHHHLDHTFGNQFFVPTEIIGHRRCREEMLSTGVNLENLRQRWPQYAAEWEEIKLTPPTTTFEEKMTVHYGDRAIELLYTGPAHTYGDTLVYLPQARVLFAGDVAFYYVTPLAFQGHVSGWIRVVDRITGRLDVVTIVPGHGPVGGKRELSEMAGYLRLLRRAARHYFRQGVSAEDAAREIRLGDYADWVDPDRILPNVRRLYQEFSGELGRARPGALP